MGFKKFGETIEIKKPTRGELYREKRQLGDIIKQIDDKSGDIMDNLAMEEKEGEKQEQFKESKNSKDGSSEKKNELTRISLAERKDTLEKIKKIGEQSGIDTSNMIQDVEIQIEEIQKGLLVEDKANKNKERNQSDDETSNTSKESKPEIKKLSEIGTKMETIKNKMELIGDEKKKELPKNIEKDEKFQQILEEESLKHLKSKDKKYFNREYTGELDEEGYLIGREGKTSTKPWQNIGGGQSMQDVLDNTKKEFAKRFPQDAMKYPETVSLVNNQRENKVNEEKNKEDETKKAEILERENEARKREKDDAKQDELMESFLKREYGMDKDGHIDNAKEAVQPKTIEEYTTDKPEDKNENVKKEIEEKVDRAEMIGKPLEGEHEEVIRNEAAGGILQESRKIIEREHSVVKDVEDKLDRESLTNMVKEAKSFGDLMLVLDQIGNIKSTYDDETIFSIEDMKERITDLTKDIHRLRTYLNHPEFLTYAQEFGIKGKITDLLKKELGKMDEGTLLMSERGLLTSDGEGGFITFDKAEAKREREHPELLFYKKLKEKYSNFVKWPQDLSPEDRYKQLFGENEFTQEDKKLLDALQKIDIEKIKELASLRRHYFFYDVPEKGKRIISIGDYGSLSSGNPLVKMARAIIYWELHG